ncbi:hypothetical protein HID58_050805 [Brassica napus]|uniref:Uncharacterized protein n=1 Tax=Brassica napus TaxID=3708 RepID=A0ABQ8A778_BRANA|nr:hypothetical protein HID58_050805 [Brassica napus]
MASTYTLLADLRAGRCSNTAEVRLLRSVYKSVSSCLHVCSKQLKRFAEEFGPEWAMQHLCKEVLDIVTNPHDLHRMMWLRHQKTVANVKFNVAKLLQSLIPIVDQSVVEKTIRQCLVDLSENPDVDVRYFANQAICSIDDAAAVQS